MQQIVIQVQIISRLDIQGIIPGDLFTTRFSHGYPSLGIQCKGENCLTHLLGVKGFDQKAINTVCNHIRNAPYVKSHHRRSATHGFQYGVGKIILQGWQQKNIRG